MPTPATKVAPTSCGPANRNRGAAIAHVLDHTVTELDFAFAHPDQFEQMSNDRSQIIRAVDKLAVETVLLIDCVVRNGAVPVDDSRVQTILNTCASGIRSQRNRFLFTQNPRLCTSFGLGHILLTGLGCEDAEFDRVLHAAGNSPALYPANKLPFRLLDDYWVMKRANLGDFQHRQQVLADYTMLKAPISPLYYRTDDYYALTHEIMYLTDFGKTSLPPEYDLDYVQSLLETGIIDNLRSYDLDVLAELVATSVMVNPSRIGPAATAAAELLTQEFDKLGLMPSRNFDPETLRSLDDPVLQRCYVFFNTYHTTHVFAMMLSMLKRAAIRPVAERETPVSLPAEIIATLDDNLNAPSWLARFLCLGIAEEDLVGIASGIALVDAVRRQNAAQQFAVLNCVKSNEIAMPKRLMQDMMEHLARISMCKSA